LAAGFALLGVLVFDADCAAAADVAFAAGLPGFVSGVCFTGLLSAFDGSDAFVVDAGAWFEAFVLSSLTAVRIGEFLCIVACWTGCGRGADVLGSIGSCVGAGRGTETGIVSKTRAARGGCGCSIAAPTSDLAIGDCIAAATLTGTGSAPVTS
jgi:hypothetical protein